MIKIKSLIDKIDAILASVPISINRPYYKSWTQERPVGSEKLSELSDVKILKRLKFNDELDLQLNCIEDAITTAITSAVAIRRDEEIQQKVIEWMNRNSSFFSSAYFRDWCQENNEESLYRYSLYYSDKVRDRFKELHQLNDEVKRKFVNEAYVYLHLQDLPGYDSRYDYAVDGVTEYDIRITNGDRNKYQSMVESFRNEHRPRSINISKVYEEWFKSLGAKYRYVIPELSSITSSNMINKFNYFLLYIAACYMNVTHKKEEFEAIKEWLESHPVNNRGKPLSIDYVHSRILKPELVYAEYPTTPENYYDTKYFTYFTDPRRKERIGKYIKTIMKRDGLSDPKTAAELEKMFNAHNLDTDTETCVVISRHEYDIVGQSTDREWTSCQNIFHGTRRGYVPTTIDRAALVAYLCKKDDTNVKTKDSPQHEGEGAEYTKGKKINIQHPIGRVLIKPFVKENEAQHFENPNWILMISKVYGTFPDDLIVSLQQWLDDNWNNSISKKLGRGNRYKMPDGLYRDLPREFEHSGVTY